MYFTIYNLNLLGFEEEKIEIYNKISSDQRLELPI